MMRSRLGQRILPIVLACLLVVGACAVAAAGQQATGEDTGRFAIPATDDGLPGAGPIRRYDWFQQLWRERRSAWDSDARAGSGRGRVPRRLDHPGLGRRARAAFPGVKIANRGISGDTTRGVLIRLQETCWR